MMTEQHRQALIAKCKAAIKSLAPIQGVAEQLGKECFEIALASLQAEPSQAMIDGDLVEVYPAPPVQVSDIVTFKTLPELERWRRPEGVRAQAAYRQLIINMLEKGE